jgi:hypothetical protein
MPALAPARPELGIPGLDYMPQPESPPAVGGEHRRERSHPWAWLAVAAALAVLASAGVAWTIGGATDSARRPPPAPTPAAATGLVASPGETALPLPTAPGITASAPSPALSVTISPAPSATSVPPRPSPRPQGVRVPDVVGDRRPDAEATLRAAGFAVSVQLVPAPSRRQARRVVAQLPGAGQLARPGSVVVLLVGER